MDIDPLFSDLGINWLEFAAWFLHEYHFVNIGQISDS
jgi:hypothetical protein